jgi:hypothetical protein
VRKESLRRVLTATGIPVAAEVFKSSTGDPPRWPARSRAQRRFGLRHVAVAGDRACSPRPASATISGRQNWTGSPPLRGPAIAALISQGAVQPTLFDNQDMAEITSRTTPGGRLIACYNPFLEAERAVSAASC